MRSKSYNMVWSYLVQLAMALRTEGDLETAYVVQGICDSLAGSSEDVENGIEGEVYWGHLPSLRGRR